MIPTNTTSFCNSLDKLSMLEWLSFRVTFPGKIFPTTMSTELSKFFFSVDPTTGTVVQLSGSRIQKNTYILE
ncbi:hypothetical protein ASPFODRAFT_529417 [Aspergillus luchuensis CBS 106.47]|uniref:Uncharacterized protein n=1 Tax=Aspergillus luchuensis (strain CBS 106.47) TaxID=1137211 RepID=A0A1M3TMS0_ASPLC|nr:hypothetical protein ASPFODRAFT_529417 [Aspergillus luchuensis CBS 106.47]